MTSPPLEPQTPPLAGSAEAGGTATTTSSDLALEAAEKATDDEEAPSQEDFVVCGDAASRAVPLVRFEQENGWIRLQDEGLELLRGLPAPVRVVAFLGQGRCGKSSTCSRLTGQSFPVGHELEPVTEGADVAAVAAEEGSVVYVDCEGSDNPLAASTASCHALALLVLSLASQVVHCELGRPSEAALRGVAALVEARRMLMTAEAEAYRPALRLLVIDSRYKVPEDFFQLLLSDKRVESQRQEERRSIEEAFARKEVSALPHEKSEGFGEAVAKLNSDMLASCGPLQRHGVCLTGAEVAEVLQSVCGEVARWSREPSFKAAIQPDGAFEQVVRARLQRSAERLLADYRLQLPERPRAEALQQQEAAISDALQAFDSESAGVAGGAKETVRRGLESELRAALLTALRQGEELQKTEERAAAALTAAMRRAYMAALPALPLERALSREDVNSLEARRLRHLEALRTEGESLGAGAVMAVAASGLDKELARALEEVKRENEELLEQQRLWEEQRAREEEERLREEEARLARLQQREAAQRRRNRALLVAALLAVVAAAPRSVTTSGMALLQSLATREPLHALVPVPTTTTTTTALPPGPAATAAIGRSTDAEAGEDADRAAAMPGKAAGEAAGVGAPDAEVPSELPPGDLPEQLGASMPDKASSKAAGEAANEAGSEAASEAASEATDAPAEATGEASERRRRGRRGRKQQPWLAPQRRPSLGSLALSREAAPFALGLLGLGAVANLFCTYR